MALSVARYAATALLVLQWLLSHQATVARTPTAPAPAKVAGPSSLPLPLRFETGHGTSDAIARGRDYMLTLEDASATLTLPSPNGRHAAIRMSLAGGNPDAVAASLEQQTGVTNHLLGADPSKWRVGVLGYGKVRYSNVYPNIDLVFYGNEGRDPETQTAAALGPPGSVYLAGLTKSSNIERVADVRWQPVASGDLDGDGDIDIVWRNIENGVLVGWLMDGPTMVGNAILGRVDDLSWRPRVSGDFTGDGTADLVWQHERDGRIALWTMNGLENASAELLPYSVPDTAWQIVGTGDFDRDGGRDLLWRHHTSGQIAVWLMDGRQLIDGRLLPFVVDPEWRIRAVGDVNGDGSADWLWQRAGNGNPVVWLMDGLNLVSGGPLGSFDSVDNAWHIAGPR